jgi:phosphohistidine swiveling domain-containing protein
VFVDLDDSAARDPAVVGAKAAWLARARQLGLPALPGVVVDVDAGRPAADIAVAALSRGSGAARLAVMRGPAGIPDRQRIAALGFPVVVRSSSPLEDDPIWSGAFSSFLDIMADDVPKAVRGCWASAFSVDALGRAERAGVTPDALAMAVLVQPQVAPDAGGLARTSPQGEVTITAVKGSPAPLLAGWERGVQIRVGGEGEAGGSELLDAAGARAVADLARRVRADLSCDVVEWALVGSRVILLQCRRAAQAPDVQAEVADGLEHPMALRLARLALRFPGDLGERLVLPWACAGGWHDTDEARADGEPAQALLEAEHAWPTASLLEAERRAAQLASLAWGQPIEEALTSAARTLAEVRGPAPAQALRRLADLRPVPAQAAAAVLRLVTAVQAEPAPARGIWEPFVYGAVRAHGERLTGVSAAPGIGAGLVASVVNPHRARIADHRPVLVAARPLPGLAPLLWGAAGLVTGTGSPAAHLLEVAHSLRVPAVVGCPLDERITSGDATRMIAAVDGAAGEVFLVPAEHPDDRSRRD